MFLAGHSAGAQIAALLATDSKYLRAEGLAVCDVIAGVIGIAGPYDFTPVEPVYKRIFPEATLDQSRPIMFAGNRAPPHLLLHGTDDETVRPSRSTDYADALKAAGNRAEVRLYVGVGNLYILGAISPVIRRSAPTLADMVAFIGKERAADYPSCS